MRRLPPLLLLALCATLAGAAAPPEVPPWRRTLGPADAARVAAWDRQMTAALADERFADAERAAQAIAELRGRLQGEGHWQAREARWLVGWARRQARLTPEQREALRRADGEASQGSRLMAQGRFDDALRLSRQALRARREVLGEDHPATAQSYNIVASCLHHQARHAEAVAHFLKGLAAYRKAFGDDHPHTATACNTVGFALERQGKLAEAFPFLQKGLDVRRRALGEDHPDTATSRLNLARWWQGQGQLGRAQALFERALEARRKALGEGHLATAVSYGGLGFCLQEQGLPALALPLHERALQTHRKVLGEEHPHTANCYNNVGLCLQDLGKYARALPHARKALEISLAALGERHPATATHYNNLALCLDAQGKRAQALPLFQKALEIRRAALGEDHLDTAESYTSVASCLMLMGRPAEALPPMEKALAAFRAARGEEHPLTATGHNNVGTCLSFLGKARLAQPHFEKALALRRKARGERHPETASSYQDLGVCLYEQGKHAKALPLLRKALGLHLEVLGEEHPETARAHRNLAHILYRQGKVEEAVRAWRAALVGEDLARLDSARSGFDRAAFQATRSPVRRFLAAALLRLGKPLEAWEQVEADLARGLLDELAAPDGEGPSSGPLPARLKLLDARLVALMGRAEPSPEEKRRRDELARERRRVLAELARQARARSAAQVLSLARIQERLPADGALVLWLDADEHWGCVVRRQGPPRWQRLEGTGKGGAWTKADVLLPLEAYATLTHAGDEAWKARAEALRRQRLAPLEAHLKAQGPLPAVRRLFVVPTGAMAGVPMEVLAGDYRVSYVGSGSVLARLRSRPARALSAPLLALGDPVFRTAGPPRHGVLIRRVLPGGSAGRAGLRPGDVLLSYGGKKLEGLADLKEAFKGRSAEARFWREGEQSSARLERGALGAAFDLRPTGEAVRAWRKGDLLAARGSGHKELPGTRLEVLALTKLVGEGRATLLLRSQASEQELDRLRSEGKLGAFRLVHLATHGEVDYQRPGESALILAQDRLPHPLAVKAGGKDYDGRLRVRTVLEHWRLDADLVVLSACSTGLGPDARGEGLLGFAQAFLQKGARSVVLSRWQVDDEATALLMVRFYENLLGKRKGLKPMPKAEALQEAKDWLRNLSAKEVKTEVERLPRGKGEGPVSLRGEARPFAHPYYWAAFVLVGDPR
jgi:tetratricopeptide (TPR) repeat protein